MKTLIFTSVRFSLLVAIALAASASYGQKPKPIANADAIIEEIALFGTPERPIAERESASRGSASGSASRDYRKQSAQEIRQARALYRSQQRLQRMEQQAWAGEYRLRPSFNAMPQTTSRYGRPRILVPVFVY